VGAVVELLDEGVIQMAGISIANPEQIRLAIELLDGRLVSVQNQFSPAFVSSYPELEVCAALGIAFLPWSPLGGISRAGAVGQQHAAFQQVADAHGVSPQRVTLAWEMALADVVIPIPGASKPASIIDSAQASDLVLTADEVALLSTVLK
jgi:aryl-alcohol dehydrogenase-like predicted oxidoreductase